MGYKMKEDYIEIKFKFPVPINKPNKNGVMYTEEAIIKACENAANTPLIRYEEDGKSTAVGITQKVEYKDGYMYVDALGFNGGAEILVKQIEGNTITSMEICGFGITNY